MKYDVIGFGEILWDLLPSGKVLGGAPANVVHRLGNLGLSAAVVSRIGRDELGQELLAKLIAEGVSSELIQEDELLPTGTVEVTLNDRGDPRYEIIKGVAYDNIALEDRLKTAFLQAKLICFGTLIQRSEASRRTLYDALDLYAQNAVKFLDINLRKNCYSVETLSESLKRATILKLNRSEVKDVAQLLNLRDTNHQTFAADVQARFGTQICLITLGEAGVMAFNQDGEVAKVAPIGVNVVDTVGAGDSFTAGFIKQFLAGRSLAECCNYGNIIGALSATKQGGMGKISECEIEALCV